MGRNDADETPPEMRWWARIEDECPITLEPCVDPVVASDGHTYERAAILQVIADTACSPLTRARLDERVVPNKALRL